MPRLSSLDTHTTLLRPEQLSDNPVIKDHEDFKLFKPSMQSFIDLIREKKIKEDSLNKLKEQVKNDAKAGRYANIVEKQAKLNQELDKNQRLLKKEIQTVLDNDSLLREWRRLPQKSFKLIDKQTQLVEDLTEEIIKGTSKNCWILMLKEDF